jgi:Protein of unknown function (DUF1488)
MLKRTIDTRNSDFDKGAIGFWMAVDGESPVRPVRVFVSYEALANIDPSQVRDLDGALTTFDMNRSRIDNAASSKFDAAGVEAELYEGQPVIILRTDDLT